MEDQPISEQMDAEVATSTQSKATKQKSKRNTDHKVLRIETGESEQQVDSGEFEEKKTRGKRERKRKAPISTEEETVTAEGGEDMDTGETKAKKPFFARLTGQQEMTGKSEMRKVRIPPNRFKALKDNWLDIYNPIVKQLCLQVRFNIKAKRVEIKSCKQTKEVSALQKGEDFVKAFAAGFEVQDALAVVRLDDLYLESFQVQDVKTLKGDHLSRAIGRIAGKGGKTKFTIENVTKTRIVMQDSKINILGTYHNIAAARRAISNLILGSPPSKVYGTMRAVAAKVHDRF